MTEQRETEYVSGVVDSVVVKGESKWQIVVKPPGSQYGKKLWSKSQDQVNAATALIGQHATFECGVSHWTNSEGKPVTSLWVNAVNPGVPQTHSDAAGAVSEPQRGITGSTPQRDDPTRDSIEKQTALIQAVALWGALAPLVQQEVAPVGVEDRTFALVEDRALALADRFYAFLQGTAPAVTTHGSAAPSFHDPMDEPDIPFAWVDRWEVQ